MRMQPNQKLVDVDFIDVGMPIDNLSVDPNGDIYAAGFPKIFLLLKSFTDPYNIRSPSTLWRIRKSVSGYEVKKILEDKEMNTMSGATIVQHDVKTGRLFIGGTYPLHQVDMQLQELTAHFDILSDKTVNSFQKAMSIEHICLFACIGSTLCPRSLTAY